MTADEELLDFFAQGLRIFGPACRARIQVGDKIGVLTFPADPSWRPPAKQFRDTRNSARSSKRGNKNG
jgi:hypothetical protein